MSSKTPSVLTADPRRSQASGGSRLSRAFEHFSKVATFATGKPAAFILAALIVLLWAVTGPIFHYSDTWQLVINTGTTVVTFLMVFLIQQSQNKDTVALHLKLNELIAAQKSASNRLINIEDLSDEELHTLKEFYVHLSELAEENGELFTTHSVDEARQNHAEKRNHGRSVQNAAKQAQQGT